MPKKPESLITAKILKALRSLGGFWVKIHGGPYQVIGLPDIVGCYEGLFFGLEVKDPKAPPSRREPTARQALILSDIKTLGKGVSGVVTGPEEAVQIVKSSRNKRIKPYHHDSWLLAGKMCIKIGFDLGHDRPISLWKLKQLVNEGKVETRQKASKVYYKVKKL